MSTFAVTNISDALDAVNYAISNLNATDPNALVVNTQTGVISTAAQPTHVVSYLYQYINVRYADSPDGSLNFSTSCTNRTYFGVRNSQTTTASNNPTDYIWTEVTGGFSTNKFLFYSTIGGRQIVYFAGNTSPSPDYVQTIDNTAIDLDVLTTTGAPGPSGPQGATGPQGNTGPAGNDGATGPQGNTGATGPVGPSLNIKGSVPTVNDLPLTGNNPNDAYIVESDGDLYVWDGTAWNNAGPMVGPTGPQGNPGATGATGPQGNNGATGPAGSNGANGSTGPRGAIALAYVLTPSDPTIASTATLTLWFSSPRTNTVPPIGTGLSPIDGDTAYFYYAAGDIGVAKTFNGSIWSTVVAEVISGDLIVTGTITSDQLATNSVTADKITANTITGDKIAADTITATNIAANAITTSELAADSVTSTKIVANTITGDKIAADTITATNIAANAITTSELAADSVTADKITANTITGDKIAADTITATNIAANAITATELAADSVTADKIVANTITGDKIAADTITAVQISSAYVYAGDITSINATLGDVNSPGYWMEHSTGDARFGGNVSIGNNLTVGNLITASALNAGVVTTNNLVTNAVNSSSIATADQPGTYIVPFYNNTAYWPNNKRGFAITRSGAALIASTNGSSIGSHITVTLSTLINTADAQNNFIELWRSGTSSTYTNQFRGIACSYNTDPAIIDDLIIAGGSNGTYITSLDGGITWTLVPGTNPGTTTLQLESAVGVHYYDSSYSTNRYGKMFAAGASDVAWITSTTYNAPVLDANWPTSGYFSTPMYHYSASSSAATDFIYSGVYGQLKLAQISGSGMAGGNQITQPNTLNNLYGISFSKLPFNASSTIYQTWDAVTVGAAGSIYGSTMIYNYYAPVSTRVTASPWIQKISNTAVDLNAIASNANSTTTPATFWVVVGEAGTILTSPDANTWTPRTSGTTQDLNGVAFNGTNWVIVGNNGVILSSSNGIDWTLGTMPTPTTDSKLRNLHAVTRGIKANDFYVSGDACILKSTDGTTWAISYDAGPGAISQLTRLAYWGSYDNINTITTPLPTAQQINNGLFSTTYVDINYTQGQTLQYYLVVGSMSGSTISVTNPLLDVNETKV